MKKAILVGLFLLILTPHASATIDANGRTTSGPWARPGIVIVRGLTNLVTSPLEVIGTAKHEIEIHKWVWPVSFIPRAVNNIIVRVVSSVNDIVILPFISPFTDDISPITEGMDLPTFVWQER